MSHRERWGEHSGYPPYFGVVVNGLRSDERATNERKAMVEAEVLYNPHPSRDPRYDVRVIDRDEERGMVRVQYVSGTAPAWWVNDDAPEAWGRVEL